MITLAIDTSDARGSVAVLRDESVVAVRTHADSSDYSAWLLPTVDDALASASCTLKQVERFAVCTGPGSFTGLRVGLTAVKAWAEVYGRPIMGLSRLAVLARSEKVTSTFAVSCYDAHRDELFAGLYRVGSMELQQVGEDLVTSPTNLLAAVDRLVGGEPVTWVSLDPERIESLGLLEQRIDRGDRVLRAAPELASVLGKLAMVDAARKWLSDPLTLDANYVRRSDAEILWKGGAPGGR